MGMFISPCAFCYYFFSGSSFGGEVLRVSLGHRGYVACHGGIGLGAWKAPEADHGLWKAGGLTQLWLGVPGQLRTQSLLMYINKAERGRCNLESSH